MLLHNKLNLIRVNDTEYTLVDLRKSVVTCNIGFVAGEGTGSYIGRTTEPYSNM